MRLLPKAEWLVFLALFLSGFAAIVNETVWQRALKVYLAGCESASSMIIVMVFMLGLGAGSICMGLAAHRIKNPLRMLALVELALFAVNLAIAAILAMDISESIYASQRLAVSFGVPLRLVYGASAAAVLLLPCLLMGITMPLVSEVAQRQLRSTTSGFVATLFLLNTLGSVLGGLAAGFVLMPYFGQKTALVVGASCNCAGAAILFGLYFARYSAPDWPAVGERLRFRSGRLTREEVLGFWLGFLSLGYEMYLFRVAALAHEPLPYNFSLVLCYFLLFWSAGLFLAKRIRESIPALLVLSAVLVGVMPVFHLIDRGYLHAVFVRNLHVEFPLFISAIVYSLPCLSFGCLFGQIVARCANSWGNNVGRFYALNTFGSCLGILAMTLVGYEMNHAYAAFLIAGGYFALFPYARKFLAPATTGAAEKRFAAIALTGFAASLCALIPFYVNNDFRPSPLGRNAIPSANYYGKDGVVELLEDGNMLWDGLWHSHLSVDGNHIGTANWLLSAVPFICHDGERIDDALVIGLGTGITVGTLAKSDKVGSVDAYEIDRKLLTILRAYPEGSLHVADNPKVHIIWQDGRAGLALNDKQYDLITQQPFYLKQAGSSILLSREYMELVKKRLKKKGVFCIYSNALGNQEQALLVRRTAASVFSYCESFGGGYMIVASNSPFAFHPERFKNVRRSDRLIEEICLVGVERLAGYLDSPRLEWNKCPYVITDDHPLVEYPGVVRSLLNRREEAPKTCRQ